MDALQSLVTDPHTFAPIINHRLHLVSAVIWIGFFIILCAVAMKHLHQ